MGSNPSGGIIFKKAKSCKKERCLICGIKGVLEKHHVRKGYTVPLCAKCHDIIHNQEPFNNKVAPEVRIAYINILKMRIDVTATYKPHKLK
jgi:hypothetical protein